MCCAIFNVIPLSDLKKFFIGCKSLPVKSLRGFFPLDVFLVMVRGLGVFPPSCGCLATLRFPLLDFFGSKIFFSSLQSHAHAPRAQ